MGKSVVRQIIVQPRSRDVETGFIKDGFSLCGVCRVCTCLKWSFLSTSVGVVKTLELVRIFGSGFGMRLFLIQSIKTKLVNKVIIHS